MDVSLVVPVAFWLLAVILFLQGQRRFALVMAAVWVAVTFVFSRMGWTIGSIAVQGLLAVVSLIRLKLTFAV